MGRHNFGVLLYSPGVSFSENFNSPRDLKHGYMVISELKFVSTLQIFCRKCSQMALRVLPVRVYVLLRTDVCHH